MAATDRKVGPRRKLQERAQHIGNGCSRVEQFSGDATPTRLREPGSTRLRRTSQNQPKGRLLRTPACPNSIAYPLYHRRSSSAVPRSEPPCPAPDQRLSRFITSGSRIPIPHLLTSSCPHFLGYALMPLARRQRLPRVSTSYQTSIVVFSVSCLLRVRTALWSGGAPRENRGVNGNPSLS